MQHAILVNRDLALNLRSNPPQDLGTLQEAIQQITQSSLFPLPEGQRVAFLGASVLDLPYACYAALLWDSLSRSRNWAVGVQIM